MSYIVSRDVFGMEFEDPLLDKIDKLDDEIIKRYQQGYIDDEFGPGMSLEEAQAYVKEKGYNCYPFPEPSSFDTLLILSKMIQNGEIEFDVRSKEI